jgi:hypothetical protein
VQIVAGAHNIGDLGVVAHAEGGVAEVLLDSTDATVHVLVNNLVETAQERSTIEALGRYHTNDLVQLRDDTVGMIIRLSANTAHLLIPGAKDCSLSLSMNMFLYPCCTSTLPPTQVPLQLFCSEDTRVFCKMWDALC